MGATGADATIRALPNALAEFGRYYFPHYCRLPPSVMHRELCAELERILRSPDSERYACAAPRGNAKSTWVSLIFVLFCCAYNLKKFIVLISNTSGLADTLVGDIAHELEENETLRADFPHMVGRGPVWRQDQLVTRNGIMVLGLGAGKRIRGRKWRQWRPDAIVLDDLENDEHVRNPEQREKLWLWMNKAVLKAKGVAEKCDILCVGTMLHHESLLAKLCDPRKAPGWRSRIYRAVIAWSTATTRWEEWEALFCDWHKPDEQRMADAHAFYLAHQAEMLAGTEVLWPEGEDYYALMRLRLEEGPTSFDSEKQNQPLDPSKCSFPEAWFQFFREQEIDHDTWMVPEHGEAVKLADCDVFGALDPSMGKHDKHNDPSALVTIAAWPSTRLDRNQRAYRKYFCLDAFISRIHPHEQLALILETHRTRHYERFGIEAIQFQELFADDVEQAALDMAVDLSVRKLKPNTDKILRIQKLGPFVYSGRLVFSRKLTTLYDQMRYFPQHAHDDGGDAVELALETLGAIGWVALLDEVAPMADRSKLTPVEQRQAAAMEQIKLRAPLAFEAPSEERCGSCANFTLRPLDPTRGFCSVQVMLTGTNEISCEDWELATAGGVQVEESSATEDEG